MKICQFKPFIGEDEYASIKECFDINWITEGPKSDEFVKKLCKFMNVKYGVLAPNGTLGIYLGLKSLNIKNGDEVIVPDFTFIASANAVEMVGATPIFCDIGDDLQIDINSCEKLINEKTKAIMPVHIYGMACNMDKVCQFAKKHNLFIIENAAQAIGVTWNDKHCGTFGEIGSFSFFADKTITTGEGGFVCTNNADLYKKLLYLRNQGRINRGTFIHDEIGYNFRMTDIQSSIGLIQLQKFDIIKTKKIDILKKYTKLLNNNSNIQIIKPTPKSNHIPFRVVIITLNESKDGLEKFLKDNLIETRTFFYPLHLQPCYLSENKNIKKSIEMYSKGICLPSYPTLTNDDIEYISNKINLYFQQNKNI